MLDLDLNDEELVRARRIRLTGSRLFTGGGIQRDERRNDFASFAHCRRLVGLTQKQVAAFCRTSLVTVKAWESGRASPSEKYMDHLTWIKIQARRNPVDTSALDVRAVRKKSGFTQAGFAVLLGVSVATVTRWESGDRQPNAAHAADILALEPTP